MFSNNITLFNYFDPNFAITVESPQTGIVFFDDLPLMVFDEVICDKDINELRDILKSKKFDQKIIPCSLGSLESNPDFFKDYIECMESASTTYALDNNEAIELVYNPPRAIQTLYKTVSYIAKKIHADLFALPWNHAFFLSNYVNNVSEKLKQKGFHYDYRPEVGLKFDLPEPFPKEFKNGSKGNPLLLSAILYVADEHFKQEWGMGTLFLESKSEYMEVECKSGRICLFAGDIPHTMQKSCVPDAKITWRISLVWRFCFLPCSQSICLREELKAFFDMDPSSNVCAIT